MIRTARTKPARALEEARRRVLEEVDRAGGLPIQELPRGWPLTRHHVRMLVRDLARDGLLTTTRDPGTRLPRVSLTPAGRRAIAGPDTEDT